MFPTIFWHRSIMNNTRITCAARRHSHYQIFISRPRRVVMYWHRTCKIPFEEMTGKFTSPTLSSCALTWWGIAGHVEVDVNADRFGPGHKKPRDNSIDCERRHCKLIIIVWRYRCANTYRHCAVVVLEQRESSLLMNSHSIQCFRYLASKKPLFFMYSTNLALQPSTARPPLSDSLLIFVFTMKRKLAKRRKG